MSERAFSVLPVPPMLTPALSLLRKEKVTSMDRRVQIIINLMEGNFHRNISLKDLARAVNLSQSRLNHLFKADVGVSPVLYLRTLRMERARDLLEMTLLSVKQVMTSVGVKDKSHFERDFKKIYGATPSRHRAACFLKRT